MPQLVLSATAEAYMLGRTVEDFLSIAETFPTAIAEAIENGWKPEDIVAVVAEIRRLANMLAVRHPEPIYGAQDPRTLP